MDTSDRLGKLATSYHRQAEKCSRVKAYLAVSAMKAAALETALQAMCFLYPKHVKKMNICQRKNFQGKRNKALEFKLHEVINIGDELGWFPSKIITISKKKTDLKELAHQAREIRNLVHPGKWAREHSCTTTINNKLHVAIEDISEVADSWLLYRVAESLRKRMKREGLILV